MGYSIRKVCLLSFMTVICVFFAGCGGGGSSSLAGGGIGGTGITASGSITGFGSIFVNGIEFETAGASLDVDGVTSVSNGTDDASVLGIGMVVTVTGTLNDDGVTGTAENIQYDDAVQGPVMDIDPFTRSFTVMGISVTVQNNTVFSNATFENLQPDDLVEVSGFFDATGALQATRIVRIDGGVIDVEVEVKGTVTGLAGAVFVLAVDYAAATTYTVDATAAELPAGGLADNQYVEVKGTLTGTAIDAKSVELKSEGFADTGNASIEGIVTDFIDIGNFRVAGQPVDASVAEFIPAGLVGYLGDGVEVEVDGAIQGGVLMASRVEADD